MSLPPLVGFLVRRSVAPDRVEDALGDLEEMHRSRVEAHGRWLAAFLTGLEAFEYAARSTANRIRYPASAPVSWIDFKLGVRMLAKYPGLTLVGGVALAFGIFVGAGSYEVYSQILHPRLPFEDGERVVMVELIDARTQRPESRLLHDFDAWRTGISSMERLGAAQILLPNLATGDDTGEPVTAAAVTASAFAITRVHAMMGRTFVAEDESPAAPDVAIIGYELWQARLGGASDVVGRTIVIGGTRHTVVGVMPPRFGFPLNQELWVPLRSGRASEPLSGPGALVFGRLAPGVTLDQAQAEMEVHLGGARAQRPEEYQHLRARVLPYAEATRWGITGDLTEQLAVMSVNVVAGLFLILVCGNVGLLMFARGAAREGDIAVRTALGASRRRIVGQLFAEALALAAVAGLVATAALGYGLERLFHAFSGDAPLAFWFHGGLSQRTVAYAFALIVLAALIAGVLPGLRLTAGGMEARLRSVTSGGGGLRFSGIWTAVIVLQVALTVTFPVVGWEVRQEAERIERYEPAFPSEQYLTAQLSLPSIGLPDGSRGGGDAQPTTRLEHTVRALEARLEDEPWVAGMTMARDLPGRSRWHRIEMDEGGEAPRNELDEKGVGRQVAGALVAPDFFDVLEIEAVRGRTFNHDDADAEARTVVVNEAFVGEVLDGRNPIGRHLRYLDSSGGWNEMAPDEPSPWYRIVGVVPELGTSSGPPGGPPRARFFHAVPPGSRWASTLLVHVNGDAGVFAPRLRAVAGEVEPDLTLASLRPLDSATERELRVYAYWIRLIVVVSGLAILLSLAGIYSVMSFTVAQRTREIGVRVALGAGPMRLTGAILRRPLLQVGTGLLLGLVLSITLRGSTPGELWGRPLAALFGYGVVTTAVCLSACIVPTLRALSVAPTEALATEG